MPRATVDQSPGEQIQLETLPEGWVMLRRMSYGEKQQRQELAMKMTMEMGGGGGGNRQQRRSKGAKAEIDMLAMVSTVFDFRTCLVDHNLQDENGQKLDLTQQENIKRLDPRIGEEISVLIDELNNFEKNLNTEDGDFLTG
jgi:hypothetical protein